MSDIEWRCRDGFCIHNSKRCDRDYNCFDHSDELDCGTCEKYFFLILNIDYMLKSFFFSLVDPKKR